MIDIFIFTTIRCVETALLQYETLAGEAGNNVFVVCPDDCSIPAGIEVIRDSQVPMYEDIMRDLEQVREKKGWYLQQMLKLSCCYNSANDCLILDGDTFFSRRFIDSLKSGQIGTTKEDISIYNDFFKSHQIPALLTNDSFITNCMYFPRELRSCNLLQINELGRFLRTSDTGLFSEYQYIGAKRVEHNLVSRTFKMRMFRRADLLNLDMRNLKSLLNKKNYDAICFEHGHSRSSLKKMAAAIAFWISYAW